MLLDSVFHDKSSQKRFNTTESIHFGTTKFTCTMTWLDNKTDHISLTVFIPLSISYRLSSQTISSFCESIGKLLPTSIVASIWRVDGYL